jgi:hypothetical protein
MTNTNAAARRDLDGVGSSDAIGWVMADRAAFELNPDEWDWFNQQD